ncbi:MAG TPA: response regulator [Candidatus Methanofastidiosa archaeon]|nr:response regulator [Candidatus Methanofastidiosa archaeon]HPR42361.1 response regulator [Candidatus Methanofastidiosa archaeon]
MIAKKILIVDDTPDNVKLLKAFLSGQDYDIIVAEDGEEALAKTFSENPDLVLLDLMLPKKSGIEVLREIKSKRKEMPVVVLTAYGSEETAVQTMRDGAEDYLINKPLRKDDVVEAVRKILSKKESKKVQDSTMAYEILASFEREFNLFLEKVLKDYYHDEWWRRGIPPYVKTKCEQRRANAQLRKKDLMPLLFYSDFSYYVPILLYKEEEIGIDNWRNVFERYFVNIGWIKARLIELNHIRNDIAHPKPIKELQFRKLELFTKEIREYMEGSNK